MPASAPQELGSQNLEFRGAERRMDRPAGRERGIVLCRWGYMLMADPAAALGETRRVLRPGGRVGLAVWDSLEANPWAALPRAELIERGHRAASPEPSRARVRSRSATRSAFASCWQAGFTEIEIEDGRARTPAAELRGLLGDDARCLARLPRRGSSAVPSRRSRRSARACASALRPTRAGTAVVQIPARTLVARAVRLSADPLACSPMLYDDDADLRLLDGQDRRHHRLRLPGPRPCTQPEGLRRRRRRRPARGLRLGRRGARGRASRCCPSSRPPAAATW